MAFIKPMLKHLDICYLYALFVLIVHTAVSDPSLMVSFFLGRLFKSLLFYFG